MKGRTFGKLTVKDKHPCIREHSHKYWLVRCECGRCIYVYEGSLTGGKTKSCGKCSGIGDIKIGDKFDKLTIIGEKERIHDKWMFPIKCNCGNPDIKMVGNSYLVNKSVKNKGCGKCTQFDIVGNKYGRWTVESFSHRGKRGLAFYNVTCDCGTKRTANRNILLSGRSKSCGCLAAELSSKRNSNDLTGQRFGRLIVLEKSHKDKGLNWLYKVKCDCGIEKEAIYGMGLLNGSTQSCGCLGAEILKELHRTQVGENNPKWKPELTDQDRKRQRRTPGIDTWRKGVYETYDNKCDICGDNEQQVHAHHLYSYKDNPELRLDLNNGVAICKKHHVMFHKEFGYSGNTPEQYYTFKMSQLE